MSSEKNILIVGVGGQGVLLASEVLSAVAVEAGYDAKKSEVHGMAQRGGVVSSHVRIGKKVYSPLIQRGQADVILAFEQAEALRWSHFLKETGILIVNQYKLVPPIASMKGYEYPGDLNNRLKKRVKNILFIDAQKIAGELGNPKLVNTILLGVLSGSLDISEQIWIRAIRDRVPKGTEDLNEKALKSGKALYSKS